MNSLRQLYLDRQNRIREALKAKADSIQVGNDDYTFMKIQPYDYQKQAVKFMEINNGNIMLGDEPGVGKSLVLETPICTEKGWIKMGDITLKDKVLGSDGKFHKLVGIFPQGLLDTYEVTFNDGSKVKCCAEHLWVVRDANRRRRGKGWAVKSTAELIKSGLTYKTNQKRIDSGRKPILKWEIPTVQPANFEEREYVIHPFILGALIGDGAISSSTPMMSIPDFQSSTADLIESQLLEGMKISRVKKSETTMQSCTRYTISDPSNSKNRYTDEIRRLGLNVTSHHKFIPQEYKNGSTEQRTELLKGLMDTDGSCSKNRTHYHTVSKRLAEDVKELTQSLGGIAKVSSYDRTHEQKGIEYRVNVKLNWPPFHLSDKISEHKIVVTNHTSRYIESIEYVGVLPQQCISVDSDDNTFVVNDYIVTHNTCSAFAYAAKHKLKTLVICPASLKLNWKSEIEKFTHEHAFVYKYKPTKRSGKINHPKEYSMFHIINFESIQTFIKLEYSHRCTGTLFTENGQKNCDCKITSLKKKIKDECPQCANVNSFKSRVKGLQYIIDKDGTVLDPADYDLIVIDEFHRIKERTTDWTKIINLAFREAVGRKVLLSGTAIKSRPTELFMPLNLLDKDMWNSFHDFGVRYGAGFEDNFGWKYDGASNLEELYQRISPFYLRRLKKD
ncbi:MAG: SNF2-related protein, partial [bacterium]|nr:SNF2-related protein [bacterium]